MSAPEFALIGIILMIATVALVQWWTKPPRF